MRCGLALKRIAMEKKHRELLNTVIEKLCCGSFGEGGSMFYLFFMSDDPVRDAERYQAALDREQEDEEA